MTDNPDTIVLNGQTYILQPPAADLPHHTRTIGINYPKPDLEPTNVKIPKKRRDYDSVFDRDNLIATYPIEIIVDDEPSDLIVVIEYHLGLQGGGSYDRNYHKLTWGIENVSLEQEPEGQYAYPRRSYERNTADERAIRYGSLMLDSKELPIPIVKLNELHNTRIQELVRKAESELDQLKARLRDTDQT